MHLRLYMVHVQELKIPLLSKLDVVNIALDTISQKKQAICFVGSKRSAEKQASDIAKECDIASITAQTKELSEQILLVLPTPTEQCKKLAAVVKKGIAFHHSGLLSEQRHIIEQAFRRGDITIICATPTLAAGLDMPAFRTILKDVKRFSGSWGMQYIPVLEYEQMAGRAGRPGKESYGEAILIAATDAEKTALEEKYVYGGIESIYSKLASEPVLRTYVLSLLATNVVSDMPSLVSFFSKSFWAHQYQDLRKLEQIIERVVHLLSEYGFVTRGENSQIVRNHADVNSQNAANLPNHFEFNTAKDLLQTSRVRLVVTPLGKRVSELYIDPLSAHILLKGFDAYQKKFSSLAQDDAFENSKELSTQATIKFKGSSQLHESSQQQSHSEITALVHLFTQCLELRPLLKVKAKEGEVMNQFLFEHEDNLLLKIPTLYDVEYEDFFDTLKTTMYFLDWISEVTEDVLLEKYDIRPGEITAKNDMLDWLVYCGIELAKLKGLRISGILTKIRLRLSYGVKEELLPLLALKQIGRVRARLLYREGFKTISSLKKGDVHHLTRILGPKLVKSIFEQIERNPLDVPLTAQSKTHDVTHNANDGIIHKKAPVYGQRNLLDL
jgi:helicase